MTNLTQDARFALRLPPHLVLHIWPYGKSTCAVFLLGEGECRQHFGQCGPLGWLVGEPGIQAIAIAVDRYQQRGLVRGGLFDANVARKRLVARVGEERAGQVKFRLERAQRRGVIWKDEQRLYVEVRKFVTGRRELGQP